MRLTGFALAIAGVWLVLHSVGTVNGGFVVGSPLMIAGIYLMTRNSNEQEEGSAPNEN